MISAALVGVELLPVLPQNWAELTSGSQTFGQLWCSLFYLPWCPYCVLNSEDLAILNQTRYPGGDIISLSAEADRAAA